MDLLLNINIQFYIVAYLVGGIPFGLLLVKKFTSMDVRESGSGSIGATNVLRVLKKSNPDLAKRIAAATLGLDAFKGMVVLIVASMMSVSEQTLWAIAVLAVVGHCYSPYLRFEGGKGVATGMGVLLFMLPVETALAVIVWFIAGKIFKISSLSSLLALATLICASFILHPSIDEIKTHAPLLFISFLIIYKHAPNIMRLFSGKEGRVV